MFYSRVEDEIVAKKEKKTVRFWTGEKLGVLKAIPQVVRYRGRNISRSGKESIGNSQVFREDHIIWEKGILDPGSGLVLRWNRIFLISCLLALFVDPLYFYLPSISGSGRQCVKLDRNLSIVLTFFRTITDFFYVLNILIKFRTAYIAPSTRVVGRGELVMNQKKIANRYLRGDFFIDLLAALPLLQILIWVIIPAVRRSNADPNNDALAMIVLLQYVPRLYLIFPLNNRIIKATGVVTKTAWAGAAYNLLLYLLASHGLGACWYLLSIQRQTKCWLTFCEEETKTENLIQCRSSFFNCGYSNVSQLESWASRTSVFKNCNVTDSSISFNYGIFARALSNAVSTDFIEKYLFCLWWGLQNLSSYGQNLQTSTFIGETSFAIIISILGLVLFAQLIGNMQTYLQSITVRLEEWRLKRRDTEEWMSHRQLPPDLRNRVRKYIQYKWLATRGVDEESILQALPADLRRDIQRQLCLDLVRRVPFFSQMDDQLLDAICERLASSLSTEGTYIVREGDPVTEMFFIIRGRLDSSTTDGGRTGFFNSITLKPGDFCGEELLSWALHPKSSSNLPNSTRTVRAIVEVEAFALRAEDLKFVANQFRRLHSKKLQHTFRYYSHQWRSWAACFIQAAWHRFKRKKMARELSMRESISARSDAPLIDLGEEESERKCFSATDPLQGSMNIDAKVLASKFAASTRRGDQKSKAIEMAKLQKPEEPDFSVDTDED